MAIEEIDLYWLKAEDLKKYLPDDCTGKAAEIVAKKAKAVSFPSISRNVAETIDGVLSLDLHLPESDPMMNKVPERLFEINEPDSSSPVLVTCNSVLTLDILKKIFAVTKIKAYIVPVDTMGYTLDNAVNDNAFTPSGVMKALMDSGIAQKVSTRTMIIPGLAEPMKSSIERVSRWRAEVGPISGFELPIYLASLG